MNLGLRYDLNFPRYERWDRMSRFNLTAPSPIAGKVPQFPDLKGAMEFVDMSTAPMPIWMRGISGRASVSPGRSSRYRHPRGLRYLLRPVAYRLGPDAGRVHGRVRKHDQHRDVARWRHSECLSLEPVPLRLLPPAGRPQLSAASLLGQSITRST